MSSIPLDQDGTKLSQKSSEYGFSLCPFSAAGSPALHFLNSQVHYHQGIRADFLLG